VIFAQHRQTIKANMEIFVMDAGRYLGLIKGTVITMITGGGGKSERGRAFALSQKPEQSRSKVQSLYI
jgi:hypothetical protein